jgi:hypothetical protein
MSEHFIPAQEQLGLAAMLKDALVRAPEVLSQGKAQFTGAVDSLVSAAQNTGDVRRDVSTRDILRMAYGIAMASEEIRQGRGSVMPRSRCSRVLLVSL